MINNECWGTWLFFSARILYIHLSFLQLTDMEYLDDYLSNGKASLAYRLHHQSSPQLRMTPQTSSHVIYTSQQAVETTPCPSWKIPYLPHWTLHPSNLCLATSSSSLLHLLSALKLSLTSLANGSWTLELRESFHSIPMLSVSTILS